MMGYWRSISKRYNEQLVARSLAEITDIEWE